MDTLFAWLCLIFPLAGVLATPFLARIGPALRDYGSVFFSFLTAVSAVMLLPLLFTPEKLPMEASYIWLDTPIRVNFGVLLDTLSIVLANVVAVISFFIMVYCLGYMKGNPSIMRFWMLMNGFIGSMLLLVFADNLLLIFVGWKLVGVCSYGLIGFYYRDEKKYWIGGPAPFKFDPPSACGLKALMVTGVGDMFMLGGILIMYYYSGTLDVMGLYRTAPEWVPRMAAAPGMMILVSVLLIAGPVGKSAQFPLIEWLPEAMAGPGPVSALIHAATMVKSGVFLVARLVPIFYYGYWVAGSPEAMHFFVIVAWIGAVTAFIAASKGLVALELKKILAYSTVSQIGYMMLAMGLSGFRQDLLVNGYTAGVFHLMSHAMFKACLFLCAGTVIHSAHSIYIHQMGALRHYLPFTWVFMTLAALSLMGVPPLPGFWSKDAVLLVCLESRHYMLFAVAVAAVICTSFYTVRLIGMVFYGRPSDHIRALEEKYKTLEEKRAHLGEGYLSQTFACAALTMGIVVFSIYGLRVEHMLHDLFADNLASGLSLPTVDHTAAFPHLLVPILSVVCVTAGAVPAFLFYFTGTWNVQAVFRRSNLVKLVHIFLWERWFIDRFYSWFIVGGIRRLSVFVALICETFLDTVIHRKMPGVVTHGGKTLLDSIQADARDLSNNIAYILATAIFFIVATVWWIR
ncbi:MAG: NADH-quinone oxidoreductase subunit L [Desulfococcaceae bacterium]